MNMKVHFSSANDYWRTPEDVYNALNDEFHFNFDPCPVNPSFDGLATTWGTRNFVNPPYSKLAAWLRKGYEEAILGKVVVFLIPSRTDTKAWHEYAMKADEIRFIKGRLKFQGAKYSAPFPSAVVIFNGSKK